MPHFPSLNLSASESWIKGKLRKAPKMNQDQPVCETCFESYFDVIIVSLLFFVLLFPFCPFIPHVCCYIPFVLIILLNLSGPDGLNSPDCYFFCITVITFPFFLTIFV